nr:TRAP transporter substrate-binding protein [uncultured Cohaesibacter sp.]
MNFRTLLASVALSAFLAGPSLAMDPINIAFAGPEDASVDGEYVFAKTFKDTIAEHGVDVTIHPNGTLGKEDERLDQTSQGLIEIDLGSPTMLFKMSKSAPSLYLPFLFQSEKQWDDVIAKSGILEKINEDAANYGARVPGFNMRGGLVGIFTTDIPVTKMSDLKGVRLRAQNGDQIKFFESWGAKGTVVSFAEVPNALQTGVAQGYFNPPSSAIKARHTDLLKEFTPLDALPVARVIIMSKDWYDGLTDEERGWVDEAYDKAIAANRAWSAEYGAAAIDQLADLGVSVNPLEPGEREKFVKAVTAIWPEIGDKDVIEKVQAALK